MNIRRTGSVDLPLHNGRAPEWLYKKMKTLGGEIAYLIIEDKGKAGLLERLSNPIWFQGLGCLLGFDWHSSGLTTVTMSALREELDEHDMGVRIVGGKGNFRDIPHRIEEQSCMMGVSDAQISEFMKASKMTAKVDGTAIQDGFSLYHHAIVLADDGGWAVIQQGMRAEKRLARRYHWYSGTYGNFTVEPEQNVIGEPSDTRVLNTVDVEALNNQKSLMDMICDRNFINMMKSESIGSYSLDHWTTGEHDSFSQMSVSFPLHVNWKLLNALYEARLRRYEELLLFPGVGPAAVRALALAAELVYGTPVAWKDPIKYAYAHGGKDGVPFPVNRAAYDNTINELRQVIEATGSSAEEKKHVLNRLANLNG